MIYKSARSPRLMLLAAAAIVFLLALAVLTMIYLNVFLKYILGVFETALAIIICAGLLKTEYKLGEESLYMRCGIIKSEIAYKDIKTVARTRGYTFYMALDINRLEINDETDYENGKIVLSPENEDEFLDELSKRCPSMVITQ